MSDGDGGRAERFAAALDRLFSRQVLGSVFVGSALVKMAAYADLGLTPLVGKFGKWAVIWAVAVALFVWWGRLNRVGDDVEREVEDGLD